MDIIGMESIKLSVIIPCYNERNTIENVINAVMSSPARNAEIIVADDCSTDDTRDILSGRILPRVARVIFHDRNLGKGGHCARG